MKLFNKTKLHTILSVVLISLSCVGSASAESNNASEQMTSQSGQQLIDDAWLEMEGSIHSLGELIRNATSENDSPAQRFAGYTGALSLIAGNYINQVYADATQPEVLPFIGPVYNYCGPGPDITYGVVHIEPGASYRVYGNRGDAVYYDIQSIQGWFGRGEKLSETKTIAFESFADKKIKMKRDGSYSFILSSKEPSADELKVAGTKNWWKIEPQVDTLLFRQTFDNYATQTKSGSMHFDRIDADQTEKNLSAEDYATKIKWLANSVAGFGFCFNYYKKYEPKVGFNAFDIEQFGSLGGQGNQAYYQMRFKLKETQAMEIEWDVPENCGYWGVSMYTDQYQVLDMTNEQTSLNIGNTVLEIVDVADNNAAKKLRFVVSDKDAGLTNWVDTIGNETGLLLLRAKDCANSEFPTVKNVGEFEEVVEQASPTMTKISPAQRQQALRERKYHFQQRFGQ